MEGSKRLTRERNWIKIPDSHPIWQIHAMTIAPTYPFWNSTIRQKRRTDYTTSLESFPSEIIDTLAYHLPYALEIACRKYMFNVIKYKIRFLHNCGHRKFKKEKKSSSGRFRSVDLGVPHINMSPTCYPLHHRASGYITAREYANIIMCTGFIQSYVFRVVHLSDACVIMYPNAQFFCSWCT